MYPYYRNTMHEDEIFVVKKAMTLKRENAVLYLKIYIEHSEEGGEEGFLVSLERTFRARWDLSPVRILIDFGKR